MNLANQIKKICQIYDIRPEKSKGQNFLINPDIIEKIIKAADLCPDDIVLEVGPGLGILTEALVKKAKKVISIELDKKLFDFLQVKFVGMENLELVNDDIMRDQRSEIRDQSFKIVANLPYNITSHFLKRFLTGDNRPSEMTLLLQREVAERICAKPGKMSLLSLSVQLYGLPEIVSLVGKENFWPEPEVNSAILKISAIKTAEQVDNYLASFKISEKQFWQTAKIGFSARRKQLQNNLASGLKVSPEIVKKLLNSANLDDNVRAQNLSVDDWMRLSSLLLPYLN
jgi:16S rRNA (adenine1518-N6/adenine1519-N6)-dimethyltransferase